MNYKKINDLYGLIDKNSKDLTDLENDIIFFPYLAGALSPDINSDIKASFVNLTIGNDYLDFIKAIMEGIGFQLKRVLDVLDEKVSKVKRIKMTGGGTKSSSWPKIISSITGLEVLVPENSEEDFAVKGAAILAGYGAGVFPGIEEGYDKLRTRLKTIEPELRKKEYYREKFNKYIKYSGNIYNF